jgi:hypothetical protein
VISTTTGGLGPNYRNSIRAEEFRRASAIRRQRLASDAIDFFSIHSKLKSAAVRPTDLTRNTANHQPPFECNHGATLRQFAVILRIAFDRHLSPNS